MINVQENIILAPFTSFQIGGPARYFTKIKDVDELREAIRYAIDKNIAYFILGGGSNLLVSDGGFDGLVIKIQNTKYKIQNDYIECDAGINLSEIVKITAENSLTGLEWAAGIPGTIGGAVRGNARAFGKSTADVVEEVMVFDADKMETRILDNAQCGFGYWGSLFKKNAKLIILSVKIKLAIGNQTEIKQKIEEIIAKRIAIQPQGIKSAGSFFLNPSVSNEKLRAEFERDSNIKTKDDKLPAGWIIDEAGLRGKKIGGAMISDKHANFLVNTGFATAEDVIILESFIKQQIRKKFNIQLESEVNHIGF